MAAVAPCEIRTRGQVAGSQLLPSATTHFFVPMGMRNTPYAKHVSHLGEQKVWIDIQCPHALMLSWVQQDATTVSNGKGAAPWVAATGAVL